MKSQEIQFGLSAHPLWLLISGYVAASVFVVVGSLSAFKTNDTVDGQPISEDLRSAYNQIYAYAASLWILLGGFTFLLTYAFVQRKGILVFPEPKIIAKPLVD